jgi:hypothetical protein
VILTNEVKERSDARVRLAICCSPFQAYIWLQIAQQKSIGDARILYISGSNTNKDRYYVQKLRESFEFVEHFVVKGRLWKTIPELKKLLKNLDVVRKNVDLYLASFNTFFLIYIFNKLKPISIYLFDDGIYSILSDSDRESHRYSTKKLNLFKKYVYRLIFSIESDVRLLGSVNKFYTIFPNTQSLVKNSIVEPVWMPTSTNSCITNADRIDSIKHIFIGDVLHELSPKLLADYKKIVKALPLDYYLPHPRSVNDLCSKKHLILLNEVAEDFILSLLNREHFVKIYSLSSAVLFTIGVHSNLTKIMIQHPEVSIPSLYKLASSNQIRLVQYEDILLSEKSATTTIIPNGSAYK